MFLSSKRDDDPVLAALQEQEPTPRYEVSKPVEHSKLIGVNSDWKKQQLSGIPSPTNQNLEEGLGVKAIKERGDRVASKDHPIVPLYKMSSGSIGVAFVKNLGGTYKPTGQTLKGLHKAVKQHITANS